MEIAIKRTGATSSSGRYHALGNKDMFQASGDAKVSILRRRWSYGLSTPPRCTFEIDDIMQSSRSNRTTLRLPPRTMEMRLGDTSFRDFGFHTITARHKYRVRVLESHFPSDKTGSYSIHLSFLSDQFWPNSNLSSGLVRFANAGKDRQSRYMLHPDAR